MINNKIRKETTIDNLRDLRLKKKQLKKKSEKKSKKIKKKLKKLTKQSNIQNIYDEVLSEFNLQHSLLNMLPMVLKYKNQLANIKISKEKKRTLLIALGAISSAALTYFFLSKKQNSKDIEIKNNSNKLEEPENFEDYFENNMFI